MKLLIVDNPGIGRTLAEVLMHKMPDVEIIDSKELLTRMNIPIRPCNWDPLIMPFVTKKARLPRKLKKKLKK